MSVRSLVLVAVLALVLTLPVAAASGDRPTGDPDELRYVNGIVTKVLDGDTIELKDRDGRSWIIRLFGIDAPEGDQPHAEESHNAAREKMFAKFVTVRLKMIIKDGKFVPDRDDEGRIIGEVFRNGLSINRKLVRQGHAWWYTGYARGDLDLRLLEHAARESKVGLWAAENPIPPWEWKKN